MEYFDVYDENGDVTGRIKARGEALAPGECKAAAGVWIINPKGELLLTKRAPEKKFAPNVWENPAGHLQAGEDPAIAASRELREETGIDIAPEALRYLGRAMVIPYIGINFAAFCDLPASDVKLQPGETVAAQWVTWPRMQQMLATGEMAPSVLTHLKQYMDAFLQAIEDAKAGQV